MAVLMPFTLSGCRFVNKETREAMRPVTLTYWRVFDNDDSFDVLINKYKRLHPHVSINYRKLRIEEYERELLNAFAEDRGPDIFSIHNTWMKRYHSKLEPLPDQITLPYQIVQGTIKKETITKLKTDPTISIKKLEEEYIPVVARDVVMKTIPEPGSQEGVRTKIFGLPLSVDTLALFYNQELLNRFGIVQPPQTWAQFQDAVKSIAVIDKDNKIIQAVVPFGTSIGVDRYFDILSLLMMQNGTKMVDERGRVTFDQIPTGSSLTELPASQSLRFYTDFSDPIKEVFTWNSDQKDGFTQFIQGKIPFYFGYSYHWPLLVSKAPNLPIRVSSMPQIGDNPPINYANYWVEVVSKKTKSINEAWDFVQFITSPAEVDGYLFASGKPTAVRSLINDQIDDIQLGIFAEQVTTAQSWYQGFDNYAAEVVFKEMIDGVQLTREEGVDYDLLIKRAAQKIAQTLIQPI